MTKKKRTVSKRYNKGTKKRTSKNRTSKKRKQRTCKKGGSVGAVFRQYDFQREVLKKDKIVLEFDFDITSNLNREDLKSKFTNYLDQNLIISVNYQKVDIQLSDDKRKALVTIPKSEWMADKRSYNDYRKFIQGKLDEISRNLTPGVESFATIEDTSVGITKVQINEQWIREGEERIQQKKEREQGEREQREKQAQERKIQEKERIKQEKERSRVEQEERNERLMKEKEERRERELEAQIRAREERKERRRARQKEKERLAATTVQRFVRGIEARTKANEKKLERETAAETIQRFARGTKGRETAKGVKRERELQERTVGELQRKFRERKEQKEAAARKIQSVQRGIVGRAEAVDREESKRIFWTNEKGDITKGTEGIVGDYKEIVRDSIEIDQIGIPILLKKGDGVKVRVLNFPTNTDPWKYGTVIDTDSLKVNVQGEGIEEWPIVRKDESIKTYIDELQIILTGIEGGDERISVINERIDRSNLLLGQDCSFGEGNQTKCNLNKDCRFVTYDISEDLQQGSCLRVEEIIEKIKPLLEKKIRLKEEQPFQQENYERLIDIYEQLNRLLKNTDYAPQIELLRKEIKEIKEKQIDIKMDEYRKERDIDRIKRLEKSFQKQREKDIQTKKRFEGFIENEKMKLKSLFTKDPKTIPQLFENGGFDLKKLYSKYLKKYPKTNDKDRLIEHYNNFIEQYYKIVLDYDKQIIERGKKD